MSVNSESVPVWQKDEDAVSCFLCHSKFSLFNRRHHCRKCGKVVCGSCSNRETKYLPNTYVVSPPHQIFLESPLVPHKTCDECYQEVTMILNALENDSNDVIKVKDSTTTTTRIINDEDYCPICGLDIRGEVEETHIMNCLKNYEFSGIVDQRKNNRMLVYNIPIPKPKIENINSINGSENKNSSPVADLDVYGDECVICLEEFESGDKVGRLECLCIFHYKCIKNWFEKKKPGECPVHTIHS